MNKKNIVLTGMMGAGKSSVGKELSKIMPDFNYIDLDSQIEKETGISINEIFKQKGEAFFRNFEEKIAEKYSQKSNLIISTGGGIVLSSKNVVNLRSNGIIFYLKASAQTIFDRIKQDHHRPLLLVDNPKQEIEKILNERQTKYLSSDFVIETDNKTIQQIAENIKENYDNR